MGDASLDEKGPFQNSFLQEMEVMNRLLAEIVRSLKELTLGFKGELSMSDAMEAVCDALFMDEVPPKWSKISGVDEGAFRVARELYGSLRAIRRVGGQPDGNSQVHVAVVLDQPPVIFDLSKPSRGPEEPVGT